LCWSGRLTGVELEAGGGTEFDELVAGGTAGLDELEAGGGTEFDVEPGLVELPPADDGDDEDAVGTGLSASDKAMFKRGGCEPPVRLWQDHRVLARVVIRKEYVPGSVTVPVTSIVT